MCPPFSLENRICNNVLMNEYKNKSIDEDNAHRQFFSLYKKLSQRALIYLLPSTVKDELQDLTFVANLGVYLPPPNDLIILSNFKSEPRKGEALVGRRFFKQLGYKVVQPPSCYEGFADLKFIRENQFIAGVGNRSGADSFHWMEDNFDLKITTIQLIDERLFHFDCVFLPLSKEKALVKVDALSEADIKKIERIIEIVPVPKVCLYEDFTNCFILNGIIFSGQLDHRKTFEKIAAENNLKPMFVDLSAFFLNGAGLSCMVMPLNYV